MSAQAASVVLETEESTEIAEFNEFEASLIEYKARYEGIIYDFTDSEQEKQARSDRLSIGKTISKLDSVHKEVKSPLKAKVDLLDGERKRIKDGLLDVQGNIKDQIAEHEAKIEAKEKELLGRVEAIKELALFEGVTPDSTEVENRIVQINETLIDSTFEHYEAEATFARVKGLESLQILLAEVKAREEEQAELERLRKEQAEREQKEREDRIAAEAKAEAERDAAEAIERERQAKIKAEADAVAAASKAEQDALEAKQRAEEAAAQAERDKAEAVKQAEEKAKAEAEAKERALQAERDAETAAQAKREANQKHRSKINNQALAGLVKHAGITKDQAKEVVTAIAKGNIPSIYIQY